MKKTKKITLEITESGRLQKVKIHNPNCSKLETIGLLHTTLYMMQQDFTPVTEKEKTKTT